VSKSTVSSNETVLIHDEIRNEKIKIKKQLLKKAQIVLNYPLEIADKW
jgi:hypothetical protein